MFLHLIHKKITKHTFFWTTIFFFFNTMIILAIPEHFITTLTFKCRFLSWSMIFDIIIIKLQWRYFVCKITRHIKIISISKRCYIIGDKNLLGTSLAATITHSVRKEKNIYYYILLYIYYLIYCSYVVVVPPTIDGGDKQTPFTFNTLDNDIHNISR